MKGTESLLEVMNRVSSALDAAPSPVHKPCSRKIDDFALFLNHDDLLARLQKDYEDAKGVRLRAEKDFGTSDGMSVLAADLEDSRWCAVQTRYLELRADRDMMERVRRELNELHDQEEADRRVAHEKKVQETFFFIQTLIRIRQERENADIHGIVALFLVFLLEDRLMAFRQYRPAASFNLMAA